MIERYGALSAVASLAGAHFARYPGRGRGRLGSVGVRVVAGGSATDPSDVNLVEMRMIR